MSIFVYKPGLFTVLANHLEHNVRDEELDMMSFRSRSLGARCAFSHAAEIDTFKEMFGLHHEGRTHISMSAEHMEKFREEYLQMDRPAWPEDSFQLSQYVFGIDEDPSYYLFCLQDGHEHRKDVIRNFREIASVTAAMDRTEANAYIKKRALEEWVQEGVPA